jgi:hypothetical protein
MLERAGDMGGYFAHMEVILDEALSFLDDLASCDYCAIDLVHGTSGFREEDLNSLLERTEIAGATDMAFARTSEPFTVIQRSSALVE